MICWIIGNFTGPQEPIFQTLAQRNTSIIQERSKNVSGKYYFGKYKNFDNLCFEERTRAGKVLRSILSDLDNLECGTKSSKRHEIEIMYFPPRPKKLKQLSFIFSITTPYPSEFRSGDEEPHIEPQKQKWALVKALID